MKLCQISSFNILYSHNRRHMWKMVDDYGKSKVTNNRSVVLPVVALISFEMVHINESSIPYASLKMIVLIEYVKRDKLLLFTV